MEKQQREHHLKIKKRDKSGNHACFAIAGSVSHCIQVPGHGKKVISFVLCDSLFATLLTGNFLIFPVSGASSVSPLPSRTLALRADQNDTLKPT